MRYALLLIALVIALGLGAVAAHEAGAPHQRDELEQAQHSRDFAARSVCEGKPFTWEGDVLVCHREAKP